MTKPIIEINRIFQDNNQTSGVCTVFDNDNFPLFSSLSLERGWMDNKRNISCIPSGTYKVVLEYSNRFDRLLWEIKDVDNRSECKFHSANYFYQLNGCVSLGLKYKDINNDGYRDITNSVETMRGFSEALKGYTEAVLIIKGDENIC